MSFLWWGVSSSALTSECPLLWLLSCPNPFVMITSLSLLEASSDQVSCVFASDGMWFSPSGTVPCSGSVSLSLLLLQASRFSLLLQSRCRLPSWGRRRRPCFRPVFLGLLPGLLFLLKGLPTFLMEHGVPETTMQWLENLMLIQKVCTKRRERDRPLPEVGGLATVVVEMEDTEESPLSSLWSSSTRYSLCRLCRLPMLWDTSRGARNALGSKLSHGNFTIFWDLIQRPLTNWKRFKWTIWKST